eukprot:gene112-7903_t
MVLLLSCALIASAAAQPADFTHFEDVLFPKWVDSMVAADGTPGQFSWLPKWRRNASQNVATIYGATDLVYVMWAVGQLDALDRGKRAAWGTVINSFQDPSTGYFWPFAYEVQNVRNWPWHPTHAAFETLALLGVSPAHEPTAVQALLRNHSAWGPFMDEYVRDSLNIWSGSQEAQSLPGIARAANPEAGQAFYDFYFGWLANFSDAATGYWVPLCGQEDPPPAHCSSADRVNQLGGAFHLYHVHSCFGRAWPHPDKVVDATLASQDSATGRWKEPAGSRVSRDELSNCIDLDG